MKNANRFLAALVTFVALTVLAVTSLLAQAPRLSGVPGGLGPMGVPLAALLLDDKVHAALALSGDQEALWTNLQAAERALRTQAESIHVATQTLVTNQFASGAPDLVTIEDAALAQHQAMATMTNAISTQAIALYSGLNTGQQAIVVATALARYQNAAQRHGAAASRTL
jgi:hypothetical protein